MMVLISFGGFNNIQIVKIVIIPIVSELDILFLDCLLVNHNQKAGLHY